MIKEVLKNVRKKSKSKDLFLSLCQYKDNERRVWIRLSQAHMVIYIMTNNLFIKEWLIAKNPLLSDNMPDSDISYLTFSRPGTAYVHDSLSEKTTKGKYVDLTNKKLAPHLKVKEKLGMVSERKMWFERVQMLVDTLDYAKKVAMNVEAMCRTFIKVGEFSNGLDPKNKLFAEVGEFLNMYVAHDLDYDFFEITSAEAFESFVVNAIKYK